MEQTNVQNSVKAREANMELLRIVAMLMVITLHCVGRGLLLSNSVISNVNLLLIQFLDSFSLTANSLFILLTGYYYIGKKFNLRKILSLWGKTLFYCILIFTIYSILNLKTNFLNSFFPVFSGAYWFITSYIALYFIMPFLNIAINNKQNEYAYTSNKPYLPLLNTDFHNICPTILYLSQANLDA